MDTPPSAGRSGYRHGFDTPYVCVVCREPYDDLDDFTSHWNDEHW